MGAFTDATAAAGVVLSSISAGIAYSGRRLKSQVQQQLGHKITLGEILADVVHTRRQLTPSNGVTVAQTAELARTEAQEAARAAKLAQENTTELIVILGTHMADNHGGHNPGPLSDLIRRSIERRQ